MKIEGKCEVWSEKSRKYYSCKSEREIDVSYCEAQAVYNKFMVNLQ